MAPVESGNITGRLDRLQEAEPLFRESLQFDPNLAPAHYQLGVLLQKQDKVTAAVEELKRAAALDPTYSSPHYALARAYRKAGDIDQEKRELQIFRLLRPKRRLPGRNEQTPLGDHSTNPSDVFHAIVSTPSVSRVERQLGDPARSPSLKHPKNGPQTLMWTNKRPKT